jgi:hypothetical protein
VAVAGIRRRLYFRLTSYEETQGQALATVASAGE